MRRFDYMRRGISTQLLETSGTLGTSGTCFLFDVGEPFRHLDVRPPRILDERDRDAELRHLRIGTIELDAVGLELLRKRLEVLDLEADVIDRPARGADRWRWRRREVEEYTR